MAEHDGVASASNGHGDPKRIKFGPRPTQDLSPEWAEAMLSKLFTQSPARFGNLLRQVVIETGKP